MRPPPFGWPWLCCRACCWLSVYLHVLHPSINEFTDYLHFPFSDPHLIEGMNIHDDAAPPFCIKNMPGLHREAFNRMTDLSSALLAAGDFTIHSRVREALLAELASVDAAAAGHLHVASAPGGAARGSSEAANKAPHQPVASNGAADSTSAGSVAAPAADPHLDIYADDEPPAAAAAEGGSADMDADGGDAGDGAPGVPGVGAHTAAPGASAEAAGASASAGAGEGPAVVGVEQVHEDYVYDQASGCYYSSARGCWFDPARNLYADAASGQWFTVSESGQPQLVQRAGMSV